MILDIQNNEASNQLQHNWDESSLNIPVCSNLTGPMVHNTDE